MSADKKTRFKSFALQLCAAGTTVVVAGLVYLNVMPRTYRAAAKVEILKSGLGAAPANDSFGFEKLPGECQTARSDAILDQVATNLNLKVLWAKRLNQASPLTTDQTRERLRQMLDIQPALNTAVIQIAATGGDPAELARIVNEIAKLYSNLRKSGREEASHHGINSLRAKWEAQNQKVQDAQTIVEKMADEFNTERATNSVQVYDAKAWEALKSRRVMMEQDYRDKSNQLAQLKSLDRTDLIKALSTNDLGTNSVLTGTLQQLAKAKNDLTEAQTSRGADAPETKSAQLVVDALNQQVDALLASAVSMCELELASIKATLEQIQGMAQKARHATNDMERLQTQDHAYSKAKANLDALIQKRNDLEREIIEGGSVAAVMPDAITARIMELADPPVKPVSPDARIAVGAFIAGGVLIGTGLLLLVLLGMKPRGAEKKAA